MNQVVQSFYKFWVRLRSSYWFIPSLMVFGAFVLACTSILFDGRYSINLFKFFKLEYSIQPDGARSILGTIAGSIISVASVTFSMTMLSLSHASSQMGPRMLPKFMEDRNRSGERLLNQIEASCLKIMKKNIPDPVLVG